MYYQITATVTINGVIKQVPTFHLNSYIHGTVTPKEAAEFARKMIIDLIGEKAIVSTFALEAE